MSAVVNVVIVAGETSGDQLAAELVKRLRTARPELCFYGVAGPRMLAAGVNPWFESEALAVRGYTEVLSALPRILRIKRALVKKTLALKPAMYIGVDAPDFNLRVEKNIKAAGIRTVHYVCPSFWAWRPERAKKFHLAVDHMLCLFPFEPKLLAAHNMPATFVGHPLANAPLRSEERISVRRKHGHELEAMYAPLIAVLPGSRVSEVEMHRELLIDAMLQIHARYPLVQFSVPMVNRETRVLFEKTLWTRGEAVAPQVKFLFGHADFALRAADVAIVASGTATLEAAMLECPQIVTYKVSAATARMVKSKLTSRFVSLPNIIANDWCVPELLQEAATPEAIASAACTLLEQPRLRARMQTAYRVMAEALTAPMENGQTAAVRAVLSQLPQPPQLF